MRQTFIGIKSNQTKPNEPNQIIKQTKPCLAAPRQRKDLNKGRGHLLGIGGLGIVARILRTLRLVVLSVLALSLSLSFLPLLLLLPAR